jgi:hypothetical protein
MKASMNAEQFSSWTVTPEMTTETVAFWYDPAGYASQNEKREGVALGDMLVDDVALGDMLIDDEILGDLVIDGVCV